MSFKSLNPTEDTVTTLITVTNGFHDGGVGTLAGSNFTTASLSAAQKSYYYNSTIFPPVSWKNLIIIL